MNDEGNGAVPSLIAQAERLSCQLTAAAEFVGFERRQAFGKMHLPARRKTLYVYLHLLPVVEARPWSDRDASCRQANGDLSRRRCRSVSGRRLLSIATRGGQDGEKSEATGNDNPSSHGLIMDASDHGGLRVAADPAINVRGHP